MYGSVGVWVAVSVAVVVILVIFKTAVVVPQQSAYVIESLGKYSRTLRAGFSILIPFVESIAYRHSLKELAFDIPEQICIRPNLCAFSTSRCARLRTFSISAWSRRD